MSDIKPVLRQMIDNNKPHWRAETIRGAHKMLGEYEAKAKAFDNLVDVAYWHFERIHPDYDNGLQYESFYKDIRDEFRKYESGEYDAKK